MPHADELFAAAQQLLPGGVTATARMNRAIGRPFYVSRGEGAYVYDLDGRRYVDMCTSHGASLLGHHHPQVVAAVQQALAAGVICAYETPYQVELARKVCALVPCAEMVRFAGSGSETVMHALRLLRAATGRELIVKFEGHFHGYADTVNYSWGPPLDQAGPVDAPVTYPESAGMPASLRETVLVVPFNDPEALETVFERQGDRIAALVMEPVNYDSGCIEARPGFVQLCRELCDQTGALLFFDEVLTAFRMAPGGGQQYVGVTPDLCVLGKAFGGGMPISAVAGRREVMTNLRPLGQSELSGTYLAHLTAVLAASAALDCYSAPGFYEHLAALGDYFYPRFQQLIDQSGVPMRLQSVGPRFGMYFGVTSPVTNYREAAQQSQQMLLTFVAGCIKRGVYFHVAAHHGFSAVHTQADMEIVLEAVEGALADVAVK